MKNKRLNIKAIVVLLVAIIFIIAYSIILQEDKNARLENNILSFNTQYKDYIDDDYVDNKEELEKIIQENYKNNKDINDYYLQIQEKAFKKVEKDFLNQVYNLNLYKTMDVSNFNADDKKQFDDLITESSDLAKEIEDNYNLTKLNEMKSKLKQIKTIVQKEFHELDGVVQEYTLATENKGTKNNIDKDCFRKQNNSKWEFEPVITHNLCMALELDNCVNVTNDPDDKKVVPFGYTANDPKTINKKKHKHYEYVSYNDDSFLRHSINENVLVSKGEKKYVEVYSTKVSSRKIYKYNIVVLDDIYRLSCKKPE